MIVSHFFDLYILYISKYYVYNLFNISSSIGIIPSSLVFLRRRHLASSLARISYRDILDFVVLLSQMAKRIDETKKVIGSSESSGRSVSSSRRRAGPVMFGMRFLTEFRSAVPALLLYSQVTRA